MHESLENLVDRSWAAVGERRDVRSDRRIGRPPTQALRAPRQESRFSKAFPVLEHFDRALELARRHELAGLAALLDDLRDELCWSQNAAYDESTVSRALLDGYAYAVLTAPDGPLPCESPLSGYLLMGPDLTYRDHWHAPREIYLVLTPGSQWCLDSGDWFDVAPGDLIVHEPWQKHAMRTGDAPLLAFAAWVEPGDRTAIEIRPE